MVRLTSIVVCMGLFGVPLAVQAKMPDTLYEAMQISALLEVMREESLASAEAIAAEYGVKAANSGWEASLAAAHDLGALEVEVRAALDLAFADRDWTGASDYFSQANVQMIVEAELEARRAFLDPAFEEEAFELSAIALADALPVMQDITAYIQAADLVEANVAAGLNSTFAYYEGTASVFDHDTLEILGLVRDQAEPLRAVTVEWLHGYFFTAYGALDPALRTEFFAYMTSEEGMALSEAIMEGFEGSFERLSREIGQAVAQHLFGVDL